MTLPSRSAPRSGPPGRSVTPLSVLPGPLAVLLIALLLGASGCEFSVGASSPEADEKSEKKDGGKNKPDSGETETVRPVKIGQFIRGDIASTLRVHATLEAVARAEIYPEISGVVEQVLRREGDPVQAGDEVVLLESQELRLAEQTRKVLWDQAVSRVELAGLSLEEQAEVIKTKELLLEQAKTEFETHEKLFKSSESDLQAVVSRELFDAKRYAFREAELNLSAARVQERKLRLDLELARQTARQSELEYETARLQVRRTTLRSPITGAVTFLELRVGELMGSSKLAFRVASRSNLEARLFVPQKELERLEVGQAVRIRCEVFPDRPEPFHGEVEVINPVVDAETGMVRVIVGIDDPEALEFLRPGMFINGEVVLETHEDALLVNKRWLLYENQDPILFLAEEGKAQRYVVETGFADQDRIEVLALIDANGKRLEEISGDTRLVIAGQNNLKPDDRIRDVSTPEADPPAEGEGEVEPEETASSSPDRITSESPASTSEPVPVSTAGEGREVPAVHDGDEDSSSDTDGES